MTTYFSCTPSEPFYSTKDVAEIRHRVKTLAPESHVLYAFTSLPNNRFSVRVVRSPRTESASSAVVAFDDKFGAVGTLPLEFEGVIDRSGPSPRAEITDGGVLHAEEGDRPSDVSYVRYASRTLDRDIAESGIERILNLALEQRT